MNFMAKLVALSHIVLDLQGGEQGHKEKTGCQPQVGKSSKNYWAEGIQEESSLKTRMAISNIYSCVHNANKMYFDRLMKLSSSFSDFYMCFSSMY